MILLHISSKNEQNIIKIAQFIHAERLAVDISISTDAQRLVFDEKDIKKVQLFKLLAKTKALLFPTIDEKIRNMGFEVLPEIYSTPIIHMDWEQVSSLSHHIKLV